MDDQEPKQRRTTSFSVVPDEPLYCVMDRIDDPRDRESISLVCRQWHRIDSSTRKHVTIAATPNHTLSPFRLRERAAAYDYEGTSRPGPDLRLPPSRLGPDLRLEVPPSLDLSSPSGSEEEAAYDWQ